MEIEILRYPGDMYEVLKWAVNRQLKDIPPEYNEWLLSLMPEKCRDITGHHLNIHTNLTPTDESGMWVRGYPHSHVWSVDWPPDTYTCLTFLVMSEEGGEFGLGGKERNDPYEFFSPDEGTTVVFDAMRWHGVKPVIKGTRISLLTSGFPESPKQWRKRKDETRLLPKIVV